MEDTQTGQVRTIYQGDSLMRRFALAPDGKSLAFVTGEFSDAQPTPLMVLEIASGKARKIDEAFYSFTPSHMSWTPDGKHLVMQRGANSKDMGRSLAAVAADGSGHRELDLRFPKSNVDNIEVHPNGRTFAWTLARFDQTFWAMGNFLPPGK